MILKVRSDVEGAKESWRLFDGVEGLHYTLYDRDVVQSARSQWGVPEEVQEIEYHWESRPVKTDHPVLFLAFSSEVTGLMHIYCSTECYLLNDSGRTIERLI